VTDDIAELEDLPSPGQSPRRGFGRSSAPAGVPAPGRPDTGRRPGDTTASSTPRVDDHGGVIFCDGLVKIYKVADLEVVALQGLDLLVEPGEFVALVGASGSGKSTLMNILGGLDVPSAGRAVVAGHDLADMDRTERTAYRRNVIGFVWQQTARNLLPYLTARQNVELPMLLSGVPRGERERRATELLERVGLGARGDHRPDRLSGGEQQRTAIAVALANRPAVLFADEPTGELDSVTAHEVFDLLRAVNQELGVTIVVVTHDPLVSEQVSRTIAIRDGRTSSETLRRRAINAEGDHHVIAEEYAVLDRAGRLQLPRAHVEALGLERRVRLVLEDDHIGIWPDRNGSTPGDGGHA
jgi:ABC-type lipoprotein export system ATPase subunit